MVWLLQPWILLYEKSKNDSENMPKPILSINSEILPFLFERRKSQNHKYGRILIDSYSPSPKSGP